MVVKKKQKARREPAARGASRDITLRVHAEDALHTYFANLNGHRPAELYDLFMREVEEPLFKAVLDYAEGNQSRAAGILGINRGTLRKKLREFGLAR
ncbi:MAG TPA: helix-turn-helix domain-containing protein [Steroidobacteraceae bacterium]|jgi:Fis family transcriptional regulator, factor for inversion stimulation protein|nr:helix-turn-helix domain-containing protein [Steroidobacteraceae bacterium]